MHKDEKWQIFARNGEPVEGEWRSAELGNPKDGEPPVGGAAVLLYRQGENGLEFLWQKRSEFVDNGGLWDYSAGGHINLDEASVNAALREAREEIGIELEKNELKFLTSLWSINRRILLYYYLVDWTGREDSFSFSDKEVAEVRWIPYAEMEEFRKNFAKKVVAKNDALFKCLEQWLEANGYLEEASDGLKQQENLSNYAFIDGQNLQLGTTTAEDPWRVDLKRFRVYLQEKYNVETAYYFVGAYDSRHESLYHALQKSGYLVVLREHSNRLTSKKKGNVDTDIVFTIMKGMVEKERFEKVILVSGDGDYLKMVDYLIKKDKFGKLLVPNKNGMSSLYKGRMADSLIGYLDAIEVKKKIMREENQNSG